MSGEWEQAGALMIQALTPIITHPFLSMDYEGTGRTSWQGLLRALKAVDVKTGTTGSGGGAATGGVGSVSSSAVSESSSSDPGYFPIPMIIDSLLLSSIIAPWPVKGLGLSQPF